MRKTYYLLILLFALSSCFSPLKNVSPTNVRGKSYEVWKQQTVNPGSPMLTVFNLYLFPTYKPKYKFQPPNAGITEMPPLRPHQRWVAFYSRGRNYIVKSKQYPRWVGIEITPDGELGNEMAWIDLSGPTRMIQSAWKLPEPQLFIETKRYPQEGSFKAELIYDGISGNTLLISYKEYVDDMHRHVSHKELRYDLTKSSKITFRSLRIVVLEATNQYIKFQVSKDGDLPWMPRTRGIVPTHLTESEASERS